MIPATGGREVEEWPVLKGRGGRVVVERDEEARTKLRMDGWMGKRMKGRYGRGNVGEVEDEWTKRRMD
jgi:hypothetical protein